MSAPSLLRDVDFNSDAGWASFALLHDLSHRQVHTLLLQRGLDPAYFPMDSFPRESYESYLLDHDRVHRATADLLGLPPPPDITTADFSDQEQFDNWMQAHYLIHLNENNFLGIR